MNRPSMQIYPDDKPRYVRYVLLGQGARTVDLRRLGEVVDSDEGWRRLCELFATDLNATPEAEKAARSA